MVQSEDESNATASGSTSKVSSMLDAFNQLQNLGQQASVKPPVPQDGRDGKEARELQVSESQKHDPSQVGEVVDLNAMSLKDIKKLSGTERLPDLSDWDKEELERFFHTFHRKSEVSSADDNAEVQEGNDMDWKSACSQMDTSHSVQEVKGLYKLTKGYLSSEGSSATGLVEFVTSLNAAGVDNVDALDGLEALSELSPAPRKARAQRQQGPSEDPLVVAWASSGKRSSRKKRKKGTLKPPGLSPEADIGGENGNGYYVGNGRGNGSLAASPPDVLMSAVVETLALAASVSRSGPGTPQSKGENMGSISKLIQKQKRMNGSSPKPRKRLFADDGKLAASGLLALASASKSKGRSGDSGDADSSRRSTKKMRGSSKASTPRSATPRSKASRAQRSPHHDSRPLVMVKELSGLTPPGRDLKGRRYRRKPEMRSSRFPGLSSYSMMKLHKRFSPFSKGTVASATQQAGINEASGSPASQKALERQMKMKLGSMGGFLGCGEKVNVAPGGVLSQLEKSLGGNPQARRWCSYEWFYCAIDKPWFERNEFQKFLEHARVRFGQGLQRSEWSIIRRSLGKPRRLSLNFLHEERSDLEAYRASVRSYFKEKDPSSEVPPGFPRPLVVGQRVTARHPVTSQIHDGSILTVDHLNSKYRVQFDRQELGVQQLDDVHIMVRSCMDQPPVLGPLVLGPGVQGGHATRKSASVAGHDDGHVGGGLNHHIAGVFGSPLTKPPGHSCGTFPEAMDMAVAAATAYAPSNMLDSGEMDMRALVEVEMLLDVKQRLLGLLKQMNDEADGNLHLDEKGHASDLFQQHYALLVRNLRDCNDKLKAALVRLQQRVQFKTTPHAQQQTQQPLASFPGLAMSPFAAVPNLTGDSILEHAKGIIAEAQQCAMAKVKGAKTTKAGSNSNNGRKKQAKQGQGAHRAEEDRRIKELITNCIAFMHSLQLCADRYVPPEAVSAAIDMLVQELKPHSENNVALYDDIKKSVGVLKTQLIQA
mmetsp:Transcript_10942/g.27613  ORF Transcript_10942/g.27613 Transcript_10942/m.27613 type:complete len:992 (-) Transcript_10942:55-3030(-)